MDTTESWNIAQIEARTHTLGEGWAIAHVQRLLKLIEQIGADLNYDLQALTWAAYLHDWGAFPPYYQPGCDHAALSHQIAASEILTQVDLPQVTKDIILEAIERHDYRDQRPVNSIEALLLREADFLDFLGVIGLCREFARGPRDLGASYARVVARKDLIKNRFSLPKAREMAEKRLTSMEKCLEALVEESFGLL
jgi:HD superfamily phosphodiesterase